MPTWVRYSVAVYLGLLLAGAVVVPEPLATAGNWLTPAEDDIPVATSCPTPTPIPYHLSAPRTPRPLR